MEWKGCNQGSNTNIVLLRVMKRTIVEGVTVIDIADKGKSIGKFNDKAIFIEGAVPGDVVDVEIWKKTKSYDEGKVVKLVEPSPWRVEPFCSHFGLCGGCKWQDLNYEAQTKFKQKVVYDAMTRLAKIPNPPIQPILRAAQTKLYRNKLEYTFTHKRYLLKEEMGFEGELELNGVGFHIPGKFNKVIDVQSCFLQDHRSDLIRLFIRDFAIQNKLSFFDLKQQTGILRNLIIRNTSVDEWMVIMVFKENDEAVVELLMNAINKQFPWITSLQYIINGKRNDTVHDLSPVVYHGRAFIIEQLENLKFIVGPKSFFQTNTNQSLELYKITREYAGLSGNETVYDLYTGTGSIAAFVAAQAKKVIGVEYVKEAIIDAEENAKINGLGNMKFFAGDMKDIITADFFKTHGKPDVIITDPPRAGMHEDVVKIIASSGASKIVYVSCNPGTQARDILWLSEKYEVAKMQPVDMFPHTSHVENVALLKIR